MSAAHPVLLSAFRASSLALAALLTACGGDNTASGVRAPGASKAPETRALEAGAALLQDRPPIDALNAYLDGFHFYSGRMEAQMEAHHYCAHVNEEVTQCVLYDGNGRTAKLVGVEYILTERLFASLPEAEKPLWHSHVHEVRSGQLIAPGIPQVAEHALMQKLVGTYGKTWHTWHTASGSTLPVGIPQLMMGFTADGQADAAMMAARDERFGVRTSDKRKNREDIPAPPVQQGADAWQHGPALQLGDPVAVGAGAGAAASGTAAPPAGPSAQAGKP
jgi:hypothetical protein